MKTRAIFRPCAAWLALFIGGAAIAATPDLPNFVFILGEGHGWSSTSVQMDDAVPASRNPAVRMPNIDKLAAGGMRFASFYAPSPRCTPSRAAYFTGKSPAQLHITFVNEGTRDFGGGAATLTRVIPPPSSTELPTSETTIAALLKRAGYATAHFGKWHVGRIDPSRYGFDASDGPTNNGGPDNVENPHPKQLYGMTERGIAFMTQHVRAGEPFYLQLSHYASRRGGDARQESVAQVKSWGANLREQDVTAAAADLDLDIALGMVLKALDELGVADKTYVLFTTDHGSPGRNPPLSGGKGSVSEGGLRVPLIVRGPGVRAGGCSRVRAIGEDLFPTIAELAGVSDPLPKGVEGGSLAPVLRAGGEGVVRRSREEFVVHFPHYDKDPLGPASAILLGDFKLIRLYETSTPRLFNVTQDPGEEHDLAGQMPEKVRELQRRLTEYLASFDAAVPTPNPKFDPHNPPELLQPRKGGKGKR